MSCKKSIYILQGQDPVLLKKEIAKIQEKEGILEEWVSCYDLLENTLEQVLEDLDTYSFLTPRKCILVEHPSFLTAEGGKTEEDLLDHLERYVQNPNPDHLLVFIVEKMDERKKIVKLLKKNSEVISFMSDPTSFVKEKLAGFQLEDGVVSLLLDYCNEDISTLSFECEKLMTYCLECQKITKEDVKLLVEQRMNDSENYVFDFVRAVVFRNKKEALRIYQDLLQLSYEPISILGLLANQFRLIYQVKVLFQEGYRKDEIAKQLQCHPYRVEKAKESSFAYQEQDLLQVLVILSEMDRKIKTGEMEASLAMDLFLLKL